jgi:alkyldihydroxyacetonephosphate synthase
MALKTEPKSKKEEFLDKVKKYFVTEILKFNPDDMCLLTILFEGSKEEVAF